MSKDLGFGEAGYKSPKAGDFVKVWLPGESPWVECQGIGDGWMVGRIDNYLVNEKRHRFKYSDLVLFTLVDGIWQPKGDTH